MNGHSSYFILRNLLILSLLIYLSACESLERPGPGAETSFVKFYGGDFEQYGNSIAEIDQNGELALLGTSSSRSDGADMDFLFVRTDPMGNILQQPTWIDNGGNDIASDFALNKQGFALIGTTFLQNGNSRGLLILLNPNGTVLKKQNLGSVENKASLQAIRITDQNEIIIVGQTSRINLTKNGYSTTDPFSSEGIEWDSTDFWIQKLDASGELIWENTFGFRGVDIANDLLLLDDEIIVLGTTDFPQPDEVNSPLDRDQDIVLIRLTSTGEVINFRVFGESDAHEKASSIALTETNTLAVVGTLSPLDQSETDLFFMISDLSFNEQIKLTIGGPNADEGKTVHTLPDGNLLLAGTTATHSNGDSDAWMLKTDREGKLIWEKQFGSLGRDWGSQAISLSDGGIALIGTITTGFGDVERMALIKTDSLGNFVQ